ncbi:MAG: hypothetical protein HOE80_00700 [Candidatus Magasanikbacteria bacterium]|jgi:aspartate kinase|nr:hypothetical protein [Candidatus Magasanikbacteria bacterium]MBT4071226.1 hypothetical protein [Candidatus Magasanikbacteria bacterium]
MKICTVNKEKQYKHGVKFGGTSLATAMLYQFVANQVSADKSIHWVIVSAPGRRDNEDPKITDLLMNDKFKEVEARFIQIVDDLKINIDIPAEFKKILSDIDNGAGQDYIASRGEYLSSKIMALLLGWHWVDAADVICLNSIGEIDKAQTSVATREAFGDERCVIGGFYGAMPCGSIKTLGRGGSDTTGTLVCIVMQADLYINSTDVDGVYNKDPNSGDKDCIRYDSMTSKQFLTLRTSVVHPIAVEVAANYGLKIKVQSTENPDGGSTMIVPSNGKISYLSKFFIYVGSVIEWVGQYFEMTIERVNFIKR